MAHAAEAEPGDPRGGESMPSLLHGTDVALYRAWRRTRVGRSNRPAPTARARGKEGPDVPRHAEGSRVAAQLSVLDTVDPFVIIGPSSPPEERRTDDVVFRHRDEDPTEGL